jgi:aspartate/methionine/tyrosine aminotransferase
VDGKMTKMTAAGRPAEARSASPRAAAGLRLSARGAISPFIVMDVMQAAAEREAQGHNVIHMEVGQPGTPAPRAALARVAAALERETLGYTVALGLPALRQRIAAYYQEHYGIAIEPERVVVTTGSSAGFVLAFLALFDVGARVALPSPGYPCYRHILTALGQVPVPIVTGDAGRWMPTGPQIDAAHREAGISGLVVASPANPTGTMLEPHRLAEIADACRHNGVWLISDEIYHGLTYGMAEATALAVSEDAIVVNSFSKYFSMTGWRIGWLVVPPALVRPIERLAQNLYISPPTVAQVAALGAFDGMDELEANRRVYADNRTLLLEALPRLGLDRIVPADGAFYLYVDVGAFSSDSLAFSKQMLAEIGIAATPGVDFDADRGSRFIRFCYAGTTADMAEAVRRLQRWERIRG